MLLKSSFAANADNNCGYCFVCVCVCVLKPKRFSFSVPVYNTIVPLPRQGDPGSAGPAGPPGGDGRPGRAGKPVSLTSTLVTVYLTNH